MEKDIKFTVVHVGINEKDGDSAVALAEKLCSIFGWKMKNGNSSCFAGDGVEVMKGPYLGEKGHIAIGTADVDAAVEYLQSKGIEFNEESRKLNDDGTVKAIYLKDDFGGFALHLVKA